MVICLKNNLLNKHLCCLKQRIRRAALCFLLAALLPAAQSAELPAAPVFLVTDRPTDSVSPIVVPKGKDGAVWSLALGSLRCVIELYDVPPYVARHPRELLVPTGAVR